MPAVRGEGDVSGGEGGNEMIFGGPDPSLRGVGAMVGGRDMLESYAGRGRMEKNRELLTRLIVENEMSVRARQGKLVVGHEAAQRSRID